MCVERGVSGGVVRVVLWVKRGVGGFVVDCLFVVGGNSVCL